MFHLPPQRPIGPLLRRTWWLILLLVPALLFPGEPQQIQMLLPGTEPGQSTYATSAAECVSCHESGAGTAGEKPTIVRDWSGSAMALAARDPVFNAMLAITARTTVPLGLDVPEYCLRCHTPSGWLAGRGHHMSVGELSGTDLEGVNCDFCHRSIDPRSPDSTAIVAGAVPGYGNGMYVVQASDSIKIGSRTPGSLPSPGMHQSRRLPFFKQGEFCGVCHDVSNPYLSPDPTTAAPYRQVPVERTYSEWKLSWFATQGEAGSCQSCHMAPSEGYSALRSAGGRRHLDVPRHDLTGANQFVPDVISRFWPGLDTVALRGASLRAGQMLARAARLEMRAGRAGDSVLALVRITNLTGHKLPSGFPEGRRMWIAVEGYGDDGALLFSSGAYDRLAHRLVPDPQLKVYEARPGVSSALSHALGINAGESLFAAFNDTTYFDNRIPPRGFLNSAFAGHRAEPAGCRYEDGQYWDETSYRMPLGVRRVRVRLLYQTVTSEFAEFLRRENEGNPYDWNRWGERLFEAWQERGAPATLADSDVAVSPPPPELPPPGTRNAGALPLEIRLAQNYPNPFNGETTIEYWTSVAAPVTLSVYDMAGRLVARPLDGREGDQGPGMHRIPLHMEESASGIYVARLSAGPWMRSIKILLLR